MENKVEGTKRGYGGYAKQYLKFCKENKLSTVAPSSLCLHLVKEHKRGLSRGTLVQTIPSAVADAFRFGAQSPTRSPDGNNVLLDQVKETIKRLTPKPVQKRPITRDHLLRMVEAMNPVENGMEVRDICILVLLFIGFLRESEAMQLLFEDVSILTQKEDGRTLGESLVLILRKSKMDQYSENATVVLAACPGHKLCPVMWAKKLIGWRFPGPTFFTGTGGGKPVGSALVNTTPNFVIKRWLKKIGVLDTAMYGSHSLRRGGCTSAMLAKVNLHTIKRHGRWKSDAVYLYMVDDMEAKLNLTRSVVYGGRDLACPIVAKALSS